MGLIALIGGIIVLSIIYSPKPLLGYNYYRPFFPFYFGWMPGDILLFFLLLIITFWMARWLSWPPRGWVRHDHRDPESILKQRYARGEISKEQYEHMMRDLEHRN